VSGENTSLLFLSLDLSTQQLKAMVLAGDASAVHESAVNFIKDLPQYGTTGGVITGPGPGEIISPVAMWVHALDLLMQRIQASGVDISRIVAISGATRVRLQICGTG
jgi:xylulokinase